MPVEETKTSFPRNPVVVDGQEVTICLLHCLQIISSPLKADRLGFYCEFFTWFSKLFGSLLEEGLQKRKKTIDFLDNMKLR